MKTLAILIFTTCAIPAQNFVPLKTTYDIVTCYEKYDSIWTEKAFGYDWINFDQAGIRAVKLGFITYCVRWDKDIVIILPRNLSESAYRMAERENMYIVWLKKHSRYDKDVFILRSK